MTPDCIDDIHKILSLYQSLRINTFAIERTSINNVMVDSIKKLLGGSDGNLLQPNNIFYITNLRIANNTVTLPDLQRLLAFIKAKHKIEILTVTQNSEVNNGQQQVLQYHNNYTQEFLKVVFTGREKFTRLQFQDDRVEKEDWVEFLRNFAGEASSDERVKVEALDLSHNNIDLTSADIPFRLNHLSNILSIKKLDVSNNKIQNASQKMFDPEDFKPNSVFNTLESIIYTTNHTLNLSKSKNKKYPRSVTPSLQSPKEQAKKKAVYLNYS